jgi:hypothetical protein
MTKIYISILLLFWADNLKAQLDRDGVVKEMNLCIYELFSQLDSTKFKTYKSVDINSADGVITIIDSLNFKVTRTHNKSGTIISQTISNELVRIKLCDYYNSSGQIKNIGYTTSGNTKIGYWENYIKNYDKDDAKTISNGEHFDNPFFTFCDFFKLAKDNKLAVGQFDITSDDSYGKYWQIVNKDKNEIMKYDLKKLVMTKSKMK